MLVKKIIVFVSIILFVSCKNDNSNAVNVNTTSTKPQLIINDTLNIPLSNGIPVPKKLYYRSFNPKGFSFTYPVKDKVFVYDYNVDKKEWEIVSLPFEGPNSIIKSGYYKKFITQSRLLYFPYGVNKLLVFDENYKLLQSYDFAERYTLPYPKRFNCYLKNDIAYFPSLTQDAYVNFKNFINTRLLTKINLKTGKKEQIIKVPDDFHQFQSMTMYDMSPEFVFPDDTTIVFIMRKSPYIYKYDISSKKLEKFHHPNEYIRYSEDDIKLGHKNNSYMFEKGFYHSLIYDKKNDKYYRLSLFNENPGSENPGGMYNKTRIDVFDDNFKDLAHKDFDNLDADFCFVNNDGLYILTKDQVKENILTFYHISMP